MVQWFLDRNLDVNHDYSWNTASYCDTVLSCAGIVQIFFKMCKKIAKKVYV